MAEKSYHDVSSDSEEEDVNIVNSVNKCRICKKEAGAHRCKDCKYFVHIVPPCGESFGDEEGFGQPALCALCKQKQKGMLYTYFHLLEPKERIMYLGNVFAHVCMIITCCSAHFFSKLFIYACVSSGVCVCCANLTSL